MPVSTLEDLVAERVTYTLGAPSSTPSTILDAVLAAVALLSSVVWTGTARQNTGTTEAAELAPPVTSARPHDRILIAGAAAGTHASFAGISPENTWGAAKLYGGIFPAATAAPTYSAWDGAAPFTAGGGGTIRNVGYTLALPASITVTQIIVDATTETVLIGFVSAAQIYWWYGGAIGDCGLEGTTYAEADGAVYGMCFSGAASASMHTSNQNGPFAHSASGNASHVHLVNGGLSSTIAACYRDFTVANGHWPSGDGVARDPDGYAALEPVSLMQTSTFVWRCKVRGWKVGPRTNTTARTITAGAAVYRPVWGGTSGSLHDAFWHRVVS